jgi:hypothetical protein
MSTMSPLPTVGSSSIGASYWYVRCQSKFQRSTLTRHSSAGSFGPGVARSMCTFSSMPR